MILRRRKEEKKREERRGGEVWGRGEDQRKKGNERSGRLEIPLSHPMEGIRGMFTQVTDGPDSYNTSFLYVSKDVVEKITLLLST